MATPFFSERVGMDTSIIVRNGQVNGFQGRVPLPVVSCGVAKGITVATSLFSSVLLDRTHLSGELPTVVGLVGADFASDINC
jgi:hypothetical protein